MHVYCRLGRKLRYSALARAVDNLVAHTHDQRQIRTKTTQLLRHRQHEIKSQVVSAWRLHCVYCCAENRQVRTSCKPLHPVSSSSYDLTCILLLI